MIYHTKRGLSKDQKERSKQHWERARGTKRIGNPRYKPVVLKGKKCYVLRKR